MELEHCWASAFLFFLVWICHQETTQTLNISISLHTDTPPQSGSFPQQLWDSGLKLGQPKPLHSPVQHQEPQSQVEPAGTFPKQTPPGVLKEVSWDCWSVTLISPPLAHTLMAEATHNGVWAVPAAQHILSLGASLLCTLTTEQMYLSLPWRPREPDSTIFFLFFLFWEPFVGASCWFYTLQRHTGSTCSTLVDATPGKWWTLLEINSTARLARVKGDYCCTTVSFPRLPKTTQQW